MPLENKHSSGLKIVEKTYDDEFIKEFKNTEKTVRNLIDLEFDYLRKRIIDESEDKTRLQVYFPFNEDFKKWGTGIYSSGNDDYKKKFNKIRNYVTKKVNNLINGFMSDNKDIVKVFNFPTTDTNDKLKVINFFNELNDNDSGDDDSDSGEFEGGAGTPNIFGQLLKDVTKFTSKKNKIKIIKLLKAAVKKLKQKLNINMMMFPFFGFMGGNKDLDRMTNTELNNMGMKLIDELKDIAIKYKNIIDKFPWFKKILNMF